MKLEVQDYPQAIQHLKSLPNFLFEAVESCVKLERGLGQLISEPDPSISSIVQDLQKVDHLRQTLQVLAIFTKAILEGRDEDYIRSILLNSRLEHLNTVLEGNFERSRLDEKNFHLSDSGEVDLF